VLEVGTPKQVPVRVALSPSTCGRIHDAPSSYKVPLGAFNSVYATRHIACNARIPDTPLKAAGSRQHSCASSRHWCEWMSTTVCAFIVVSIVEILLNGDVTVTCRPMTDVGSNIRLMSSQMRTCLVWLCYAVCAKQYVSTITQVTACRSHTAPRAGTNYAILGAGADSGAGAQCFYSPIWILELSNFALISDRRSEPIIIVGRKAVLSCRLTTSRYAWIDQYLTSCSVSSRTQTHAARSLNPSLSYVRIWFGFSFTMSFPGAEILAV